MRSFLSCLRKQASIILKVSDSRSSGNDSYFRFLSLCLVLLTAIPVYAQVYSTRDDIPANAPFGRASPEALAPAPPPGPRTTVAAPVENVDSGDAPEVQAVESQDLAPPEAQAEAAPPAASTVYAAQEEGAKPTAVLRCLNKVTAKHQEIKVKIGERAKFGQLSILPLSCRSATPESLPEYASLIHVQEAKPVNNAQQAVVATSIFHGWILASSPSLSGLEHPVYDISLVRCTSQKPKT